MEVVDALVLNAVLTGRSVPGIVVISVNFLEEMLSAKIRYYHFRRVSYCKVKRSRKISSNELEHFFVFILKNDHKRFKFEVSL